RPRVPGEAHEVDAHTERRARRFGWADARDVGDGERQPHLRRERHRLARRLGAFTHGRAPGREALDQAHRLEEVEAVCTRTQPVACGASRYRMVCAPANGSHRFHTSSRWMPRAASWVNVLTDA